MNGVDVAEEEFVGMEPQTQMLVIYKNVRAIKDQCNCRQDQCNVRFDKIEKRKWWNAAASGIGGVVGGFAAMMARALWR